MRITRQTPTELVVADSSMWLSAIFAAAACMPAGIAISEHKPNGFYAAAILLFFAVVWMRKTQFTFDARQHTARWTARKIFKVQSGSIPFDDVRDIIMDTMSSDKGTTMYRLSIVTSQGSVQMEAAYNGGRDHHVKIREAIFAFLHPDAPVATNRPTASGIPDDSMIGSLLAQGRKIDAIRLLRSTENLTLTEATQRVEAMDVERRTGGARR